ncbi:MAG: phosphoribosylaminoimidazolesuccinocarboxamide synthase [Candidatus Shapirobacteria bacterium]
MGSVKDLRKIQAATKNCMGVGEFKFSDRFSVFDWGEMPDLIDEKGKALTIQGALFFEEARKLGIRSHYLGLINEKGHPCFLSSLDYPSDTMRVALVNVIEPVFKDGVYDYSEYKKVFRNYLLPGEFIYVNEISPNSSILRDINSGKLAYQKLGLDEPPVAGQVLPKPYLYVTTKLESKDRRIDEWEDFAEMAGISMENVDELKDVLMKANEVISSITDKIGMVNKDGKIEMAVDDAGEFMIVDVACTLDECRFAYNGVQVSKDILRDFYKTTEWKEDIERAKKLAEETKNPDWKSLCTLEPESLPEDLLEVVSDIYMATSNAMNYAINGKELFEAPSLETAAQAYFAWKEKIG